MLLDTCFVRGITRELLTLIIFIFISNLAITIKPYRRSIHFLPSRIVDYQLFITIRIEIFLLFKYILMLYLSSFLQNRKAFTTQVSSYLESLTFIARSHHSILHHFLNIFVFRSISSLFVSRCFK